MSTPNCDSCKDNIDIDCHDCEQYQQAREGNFPKITYKMKGDTPVYNRASIMARLPYRYKYKARFGITYWEHPIYGEDGPVLADLNGTLWETGFYDPWNDCDQGYIIQQAVELGLLPADTILWEGLKRADLAAELRGMQVNLFATHRTMDDLHKYIEQFSGAEKALAYTIMGITTNTVLEVIAQDILDGGR